MVTNLIPSHFSLDWYLLSEIAANCANFTKNSHFIRKMIPNFKGHSWYIVPKIKGHSERPNVSYYSKLQELTSPQHAARASKKMKGA